MTRCPGQDQRYWKPDDIFDVGCPYCGRRIEFWKDEPFRICRRCQREVRNPRIDLACARWCASADECLGRSVEAVATPVVERLMALLEERLGGRSDALDTAREVCARVDTLLSAGTADPRLAKPSALLVGALLGAGRSEDGGREPEDSDGSLGTDAMLELLARSGLEDDEARSVTQLVGSVLSGRAESSAEWRLVSDALAFVRIGSDGERVDGPTATRHTATARRI